MDDRWKDQYYFFYGQQVGVDGRYEVVTESESTTQDGDGTVDDEL